MQIPPAFQLVLLAFVILGTAARESGVINLFVGKDKGEVLGSFLGSVIAALYAYGVVSRPKQNTSSEDEKPK